METVMEARVAAANLLGVAVDADEDELKAAYRVAVKTVHPDAGGDAEKFEAVTAAFDLLSTPMPELAAEPAEARPEPRPETPPLFERDHVRVGLIALGTPLVCALVIVVYVLAPGVAVALIGAHVAGLWVRVLWISTGRPQSVVRLWGRVRPWSRSK